MLCTVLYLLYYLFICMLESGNLLPGGREILEFAEVGGCSEAFLVFLYVNLKTLRIFHEGGLDHPLPKICASYKFIFMNRWIFIKEWFPRHLGQGKFKWFSFILYFIWWIISSFQTLFFPSVILHIQCIRLNKWWKNLTFYVSM